MGGGYKHRVLIPPWGFYQPPLVLNLLLTHRELIHTIIVMYIYRYHYPYNITITPKNKTFIFIFDKQNG